MQLLLLLLLVMLYLLSYKVTNQNMHVVME